MPSKRMTTLNIHRKSANTWLKILVFERKRCSKLHFTEAQPQLVEQANLKMQLEQLKKRVVLNLFLIFDQF